MAISDSGIGSWSNGMHRILEATFLLLNFGIAMVVVFCFVLLLRARHRLTEGNFVILRPTVHQAIIYVNKRLLLPKDRGGYGMQSLTSVLTCWHYICTTSLLSIAAQTGILTPRQFPSDQNGLRWFLIIVITIAPLSANFSLLLNTVATYQLFKILQTPVILAFATSL